MDIIETIQKAIKLATELRISARHGHGDYIDTILQPYIQGDDTYQYRFVWGYIPHNGLYYKFFLDNIKSAKLGSLTYTARPDAVYLYSIEESLYAVLPGFDKISFEAELCTKNKDQETEN